MEFIRLTRENLEREHICCAIANNKDCQVASKKEWLKARFDEGLVFLKGNVRGKCFIEYVPAENAWAPIEADGYLYIDCLWVSGQFKGKGYSNELLDACIKDAKAHGKVGIVTLSSPKKKPFLADKSYLLHKGFSVADSAKPYFELMYLPFEEWQGKPRFKRQLKEKAVTESGFVLYYSAQCPFTAKYVPLLERAAKEAGASFQAIKITTTRQAQSVPAPFTTFSLFFDGEYVTHEILSEKKFTKLLQALVAV